MFFINGQKAFSGAQEKSCFINMFKIMSEKFPVEEKSSAK